MDTDHELLRLGLLANAAFSLATGALLTAMPSAVGGWLGVDIDGWLRLLGVALISHFAILVFVARLDRPEALARLNIAAIAPYPLLMIGLVATGLVDRGLGQALVLIDGAVVATTAVMQGSGLRRMRQMPVPQPA